MREQLQSLFAGWRKRAAEFRALTPKKMQAAGISAHARDYAVAHYEDRAKEVEVILQAGE